MRHTRYSNYFKSVLFLIDICILIGVFYFFLTEKYNLEFNIEALGNILKEHYKASFIFLFSWVFISNYTKLYKSYRYSGFFDMFKRCFFQISIFSVLAFAVSGMKKEVFFGIHGTIKFIIIVFLLLIAYRFLFNFLIKKYRSAGYNNRNVIFVGTNENTLGLYEMLNQRKSLGIDVLSSFIKNPTNPKEQKFSLENIQDFMNKEIVHFIYISMNGDITRDEIKEVVELAQNNFVQVNFIPDSINNIQSNLITDYVDTFPIFRFTDFPLDKVFNQYLKRVFDIAFSLTLITLIFSWLFPIIILFIVLGSGFPVFFTQKRNGLNGKVFDCFKFRTMRLNKESNSKPTERNDPRITRIGKFLRKTSLDELPQFINVLLGHMSVVGPRPHMVSENERYDQLIKQYSLRHFVKPGITGLAQIRGYRGKIESNKDMLLRVKSDIFYIKQWSFILDIFIVIKTVVNVVKGDKNAF